MKLGLFAYSAFPDNRFNPGIENYVYNLASELATRHEVHLFESASHGGDRTVRGAAIHRVKPLVSTGAFAMNQLSFVRRTVRRYRRTIDSLDVAHDLGSFLPYFLADRGVPVLTTFYHYESPSSLRKLVQMVPCPLLVAKEPFADAVVAVSSRSARQARRHRHVDPIAVVPAGVDPSVFSLAPDESRTDRIELLYVGPLRPRKNVGTLIEALRPLRESADRDVRLSIVGEGYLEDRLRERASAVGVSSAVRFEGYVPGDEQLCEYYRQADLLVLPSRLEGFGMVTIESMACATPVAASDVEPLTEIVDGGGVFFDPTSPDSIAEAVLSAVEDPEYHAQLSAAARAKAAEFSWSRVATEYEAVYRKLTASG